MYNMEMAYNYHPINLRQFKVLASTKVLFYEMQKQVIQNNKFWSFILSLSRDICTNEQFYVVLFLFRFIYSAPSVTVKRRRVESTETGLSWIIPKKILQFQNYNKKNPFQILWQFFKKTGILLSKCFCILIFFEKGTHGFVFR